jgi:hypothetical protein
MHVTNAHPTPTHTYRDEGFNVIGDTQASSDEIFQLTTLLEDHAAIYVDFVHQHLRALASGSPLEREKSMRSSIGGDF